MAKLGEGLRNVAGATFDAVGVTGFRFGWQLIRERQSNLNAVPIAFGTGVLAGAEQFFAPNAIRDSVIEDTVSVDSEYLKGRAAFGASILLDGLSFAGAVGVGFLTQSFEAAIVAKVALNAGTSFAVRTADSIQRRRVITV